MNSIESSKILDYFIDIPICIINLIIFPRLIRGYLIYPLALKYYKDTAHYNEGDVSSNVIWYSVHIYRDLYKFSCVCNLLNRAAWIIYKNILSINLGLIFEHISYKTLYIYPILYIKRCRDNAC